jgi:hypothetical protein
MLSLFDPWLPRERAACGGERRVVPIFAALWIFSFALDILPRWTSA